MRQGRRHTTVTFGGRPKSLNTSYIQPVCQLFEEADKKKVFTTDKSQVSHRVMSRFLSIRNPKKS